MKKLLAIMLCAMLIFALPIVASAEGESANDNAQEAVATENLTTETETATESEISASNEDEETMTEQIVDYITANIDKVVVIITMVGYSIIESRIRAKTNGSIGTLNNNAIAIANNSTEAIKTALEKVDAICEKIAEENKAYQVAIDEVKSYLKTSKLANKALADEVAQILNFANIPTSKKDELYKIHIENVKRLEAEEVKSNDGKEA